MHAGRQILEPPRPGAVRGDDIDGTVAHPALRRLFAYWQTIGGAKRWPGREDLDPVEIQFVLGNVNLIDVAWQPLRFRYRLVGAHLAWRMGYDPTGHGPESLPDPFMRAHALEAFTQVATTGRPRARQFDRRIDGVVLRNHGMTLPLSSDQAQVDLLLVGQMFRD